VLSTPISLHLSALEKRKLLFWKAEYICKIFSMLNFIMQSSFFSGKGQNAIPLRCLQAMQPPQKNQCCQCVLLDVGASICENFNSLKKSPAEIFENFPTHIVKNIYKIWVLKFVGKFSNISAGYFFSELKFSQIIANIQEHILAILNFGSGCKNYGHRCVNCILAFPGKTGVCKQIFNIE
jgi:hypothetical protein